MGKQQYPSDVLTAKQLMTDFVPAAGATKCRNKPMGLTDMVFAETKKQGDVNPIYYCCVKQHPGGYMERHNITKEMGE